MSSRTPSSAERAAAAPNTDFLSAYLKGVESGNQRAIARNAARGAVQAVGASGAAALRPTLQKAANRGIDCVRRAVLMSANESKQTLCVALLREVAQVFGFSLAVTVDGEEQHGAGDEEELAPLPLGSLRVALRGGAPAGAAALPRGARGRGASLTAAAAAISRARLSAHSRLQLAALRAIGLRAALPRRGAAGGSTSAAADHLGQQQQQGLQEDGGDEDEEGAEEYEQADDDDDDDDDDNGDDADLSLVEEVVLQELEDELAHQQQKRQQQQQKQQGTARVAGHKPRNDDAQGQRASPAAASDGVALAPSGGGGGAAAGNGAGDAANKASVFARLGNNGSGKAPAAGSGRAAMAASAPAAPTKLANGAMRSQQQQQEEERRNSSSGATAAMPIAARLSGGVIDAGTVSRKRATSAGDTAPSPAAAAAAATAVVRPGSVAGGSVSRLRIAAGTSDAATPSKKQRPSVDASAVLPRPRQPQAAMQRSARHWNGGVASDDEGWEEVPQDDDYQEDNRGRDLRQQLQQQQQQRRRDDRDRGGGDRSSGTREGRGHVSQRLSGRS